jgi:hypothetical protein
LLTVTDTADVANVFPAESSATARHEYAPRDNNVVFQTYDADRPDTVVIRRPSRYNRTLATLPEANADTVTVSRTVLPLPGVENLTVDVVVAGGVEVVGGAVAAFLTVVDSVDVASVLPAESWAIARHACDPLAPEVVFHTYVADFPETDFITRPSSNNRTPATLPEADAATVTVLWTTLPLLGAEKAMVGVVVPPPDTGGGAVLPPESGVATGAPPRHFT